MRPTVAKGQILRTDDFDYSLPPDLIAQSPVEPRDASRLLVVDRANGLLAHHVFRDIVDYLRTGDVLVLNDSRVLRARLKGRWTDTGGAAELLLLNPLAEGRWSALVRPGRRARHGRRISLDVGVAATIEGPGEDGVFPISLPAGFDPEPVGEVPLPPYVHAALPDPERYQTVFAREKGSVAAPTAGLHFTADLLTQLRQRGVDLVFVTLHVGIGTFRPVVAGDPREHQLHREHGVLPPSVAQAVLHARQSGNRVVAVGTTSARLLEQWAAAGCAPGGWSGWTHIYLLPGHRFRAVDGLLTNFHLPRTTLLMLVSAFAGRDLVLAAYHEAIGQRYRFYSFGDAMLIV